MGSVIDRAKRAWSDASEENITLLSAGIAFYAFLAMVPLLAVVVLTYGLVADAETVARHAQTLAETLPPSAAELVTDQLDSVIETRTGAQGLGLLLALSLALFSARSAALAIVTGMNIAFHADENRGILKANLMALAITGGAVLALGLVAGASALSGMLRAGFAGAASFLVVGAAGFAGACILYRIGPNRPSPAWHNIMPGAALFAIGWMVASAGFGFYAANLGSYNATYGSLGAVIVLMTWLFLSAFFLLFGAHFSAVCARAPAQ